MIELPEALVLAEQINHTLAGKTIKKATADHTPHKFAWYTGDPTEYNNLLAGKTIGKASASGGHVEIRADGKLLILSVPLKYHAVNEKLPVKHQLLLEFEDNTALSCTIQMWGGMFCIDEGSEEGAMGDYFIAKKRPSPFSDQFDRYFSELLADENTSKLSAKAFLATEQRVPGLGNGVLQDILWTAHIHPKRKMSQLSPDEITQMLQAVKSVLREMTVKGGRDTERDLFGCPGGYKTIMSKNTADQPCPVCSTTIKKEAYMGGSIYYCGGCQRS